MFGFIKFHAVFLTIMLYKLVKEEYTDNERTSM